MPSDLLGLFDRLLVWKQTVLSDFTAIEPEIYFCLGSANSDGALSLSGLRH